MKKPDITATTRQPLYSGWEWRNKADGIIVTDQEIKWLLQNDIITIVDLREEKEFVAKPCRLEGEENNIKRVLEAL